MTESTPELRVTAPAKINLGLEVLRRREDGFHDINTVFAALRFGDGITLRRRDDGVIHCRVEGSPGLSPGTENLCVRAADALRGRYGRPELGLDIDLEKRIPMGAGLGGGSSDAAAVLRGASRLWELDRGSDDLLPIAASLGSDVPFFLLGGVAGGESRGEVLHPFDLDLPFPILLVNPGVHIPTPWAYTAVGRRGERSSSDLLHILEQGVHDPKILRLKLVNDFEEAVFREYPLLSELKERLYEAGALFALMSGSGSTLFGLFAGDDAAAMAAMKFKEYWNVVTTFERG